jgi:hypothetical protein
VTFGRWLGVTAAIGWSSYGVLIDDYSFFIANIIFLWIYASALYKFNRKRDEYKATFEEQQAQITKLKKQVDRTHAQKEKQLSEKEAKIRKIAERAEKNLIDIRALADSL